MNNDDNKSREQSIVLQKWKESNFKGTYIGFTGVGKTKIGTIAAAEFIRRDPKETSLVVVPTENLRDNEWEKSFNDWGYHRERDGVEIMCIQSAHRLSGKHYNTIVIDEWHTTLGPKYRDLLKNNTYDRLLCLTATIDDDPDKLAFTKEVAPIIWTTDRERAISLKLVSESMVFNLAVELTYYERKKYDVIDSRFKVFEEQLGGKAKAFDVSSRFLRLKYADSKASNMLVYISENRVIYKSEVDGVRIVEEGCRRLTSDEAIMLNKKISQANGYWTGMRERRTILINAENKIAMVKRITDKYSDRKGIIFSESISMADKISTTVGDKCTAYHSKLGSTDAKAEALRQFSIGTKQFMSSVKALNAGMDVPDCSLGIATSGDSKKLMHVQRNGRISRYIDGKVSYFFNLYCKDTQEVSWIRNGTKLMNPKWITSLEEAPIN